MESNRTFTMDELVFEGVLIFDGEDDDGILFQIDWNRLREYNYELYLHFRQAELLGEIVHADDTMEA